MAVRQPPRPRTGAQVNAVPQCPLSPDDPYPPACGISTLVEHLAGPKCSRHAQQAAALPVLHARAVIELLQSSLLYQCPASGSSFLVCPGCLIRRHHPPHLAAGPLRHRRDWRRGLQISRLDGLRGPLPVAGTASPPLQHCLTCSLCRPQCSSVPCQPPHGFCGAGVRRMHASQWCCRAVAVSRLTCLVHATSAQAALTGNAWAAGA